MNATNQKGPQDRLLGSFSPAIGVLALQSVDQQEWLETTERYDRNAVEFADRWEEEFARLLDEHQILWQYKQRTFAVEWDEEGNFVDSFTPDFYLPVFDKYVELARTDYRASGAKARKVRLLRAQHPEIKIELLNVASPSPVFETFS
jgi:phosphatidate phosphatase APP1